MDMRAFGRTGMRLSVLGFGCGEVGGLMGGDPFDQERTHRKRNHCRRQLL
jgi:aryl-alcohol dehydrogenase-like predicted oxidoreductase